MKKIVYFISAFLIGMVFNFNTEAYAATTHYFTNQDATAYNGSTCGHGCSYGYFNIQYSTVAMHKDAYNKPLIAFGTQIVTESPLYLDGANTYKSTFTVSDTGPGTKRTSFWIDVYYGSNLSGADKFGVKKVSYHSTY